MVPRPTGFRQHGLPRAEGETSTPKRRGRPTASRQGVGWLAQVGLLSAIPLALLIGPALGYYIGTWCDQRWSSSPWGMGIGIVIGLLSSARVTIQLIRQAKDAAQ